MSRSREERRKIEQHKFISKIKKVFATNNVLKNNFLTWVEMAKDSYGLLFKHTKTPISKKSSWEVAMEKRAHHKEKVAAKKVMLKEVNEYKDLPENISISKEELNLIKRLINKRVNIFNKILRK